ncbi:hypothetical protein [Candidatus Williamhamiltonella defendens]|uniref:Uncharacterized protein n=2 Tax=Candidatus Williamhamiltonella defendens TaxID=138072 RepID=A0A249DYS0_9ENTR|nr:hypothetical protein [Candidatus Hamiltonella defensa]ASX26693.1 hypothetical protein BA171_06595 [Candidatus Hamiltonella defensa (Bemisia tabaci)]
MNKKFRNYLNKPIWQIFLYQWFFLGILIYVVYIFDLHLRFNLLKLKKDEILNQKKMIEKIENKLSLLPELFYLEKEIQILKLENIFSLKMEYQKNSLKNDFYQKFNHLNIQLINWEKQKIEIKENFIHKNWIACINTDYYGIINFLGELLKTNPPILIKKIDIFNKSKNFHDLIDEKENLEMTIQITQILPINTRIKNE